MYRPYGSVLKLKFSKQGSLFGRFSINMTGLSRNLQKRAEKGSFSTKIQYKSGYNSKLR